MIIKYKILDVQPDNRIMIVRYWTKDLSEEDLRGAPESASDGSPIRCRSDVAINIPIPEPTEDELHEIILRNAPNMGLKTLEMIKKNDPNTALTIVHTLKGKTFNSTENMVVKAREPKNKIK